MPDATFACPDLTTFCRLDELGLEVTGQRLEPDRAVLACRVMERDPSCRCEPVRLAPHDVPAHAVGGRRDCLHGVRAAGQPESGL